MCTTVCFKKENQIIVGNNEDTFIKNGMIFTNHRGLRKRALLILPENPLEWVSKYGSISFSQSGKEFPCSGINEKGLVVEQMTLPESIYPENDYRPGIKELQWIQMILDTCDNVQAVVEITKNIRFAQASWPIHFLVCDATGDYRIIEFLNGELHTYGDSGDRVPVLTNSKYLESIDYMKGKKKASEIQNPYLFNSIERFVKACHLTSKVKEFLSSPTTTGFDILSQVSTENTIWSFVYNVTNPTLYIKDFFNKSKFSIALKDLDFSQKSNWKVMELSSKRDILCEMYFEDYTFEKNKTLVESFYHNKHIATLMGYKVPNEALMSYSLYPERLLEFEQ
jgi:penicillin V acylase-like amidase (Ntn superfamily)